MKNRILIINYYYPPVVNGGVQRTYNFKKYLSKNGFNVAFLTTSSFGRLEDDAQNEVYRFPDWGYDFTHNKNCSKTGVFLFRAWRLAQVKLGLITDGKYYWKREVIKGIDDILSSKRVDLVLASYPTPANLELGEYINKRYGIPLVVDYRDGLMFDSFIEIQESFILYRKRLLSLEQRIAKTASLQLTVNQEMNEYYSSKYPDVRTVMIPNGFDDEETIASLPVELPQGINILYTGSIGKSRKIYSYKELGKLLHNLFTINEKINFVFIGDYEKKEKEIFSKYKNVYVYNKTDRKTIIATQRVADALLLISGPSGATSGKLYEYLFSGKPILNVGGLKGISNIINGQMYGITCGPEEISKMERFLDELYKGTIKYEQGDLQQFTRRYQGEVLAQELHRILG